MPAATSSKSATTSRGKENAPPAKTIKRLAQEVEDDEDGASLIYTMGMPSQRLTCIQDERGSKSRVSSKSTPSTKSVKPTKSSSSRTEEPSKEDELDTSTMSTSELQRRLKAVSPPLYGPLSWLLTPSRLYPNATDYGPSAIPFRSSSTSCPTCGIPRRKVCLPSTRRRRRCVLRVSPL